jgi:hypothetical protein
MSATSDAASTASHGHGPPDTILSIEDGIIARLPIPWKKWPPGQGWSLSIAARRASGKSTACTQLVKRLIQMKVFARERVLVLSPTAGLATDWDFLPRRQVVMYDPEIITRLWERQRRRRDEGEPEERLLCVLDDCLVVDGVERSPEIRSLYVAGRHISVSVICCSQTANRLLSPAVIANSDLVLWSKLNVHQTELIWRGTTGIDRKAFIAWSERNSGHDYAFCLFDASSQSVDPADFLAVVRADPPPKRQRHLPPPED